VRDKHVFWLQISVKDVLGVQVMQRQKYVRSVKSGSVFLESPNLRQIEKKLSSRAVLKDEKQFAVALEGVVHLDYKWVPDVFQNSSFRHGVLNLISPNYFSFLQNFQCIQLSCVLFLDQHNFSVRALANNRNHLEVFLGNMGSRELLLLCDNLLVLLFQLFILRLLLCLCQLHLRLSHLH
jgi:hypothetical protein